MSENGEKAEATEGGKSRLLRFSESADTLNEKGAFPNELWSFEELIKRGRLQSQLSWDQVDALEKLTFPDLLVDASELQQVSQRLIRLAEQLCRQSVAIEMQEVNAFLLQQPGLFVDNDKSGAFLVGIATSMDERSVLALYSDETAAPIQDADLLLDANKFSVDLL